MQAPARPARPGVHRGAPPPPGGRRPTREGPRRFGPFSKLVVWLALAPLVMGLAASPLLFAASRVADRLGSIYGGVQIPRAKPQLATTYVYDRNGNLITTLHAAVNRTPVPLSRISLNLQQAVISAEDREFYSEGGVNVRSIMRAAIVDLAAGQFLQGGSTITQQLVKNLYTGDSRTLGRKIHEALIAEKLDRTLTKDQILQRYLNTVYFGQGAYGAQAAAETYFGVRASKLTVLQSATLAGTIAAPGMFDPIVHPAKARARRNWVLQRMAVDGYMPLSTAETLAGKPLGLHPGKVARTSLAPYFVQYVKNQLERRYGTQETFGGGLRVTTTLDLRLQKLAEQAVMSHLSSPSDPQAALVSMDPRTGQILAMVGGRNWPKSKLNLATNAHRSTGSAFKVFTMAAAMEQHISLDSTWHGPPTITIKDPRCFDQTGQPWTLSNSADESAGTMTLQDALANSVNTIFAQLVTVVGPPTVVTAAHAMGITSPLTPLCSITLGTEPVTPLEMTDGYATLAARGVHHSPQPLLAVKPPTGRTHRFADTGHQAIPQNDADLVTYAMQGVIEHGTGIAANLGRSAAGKTGTAENYDDAWFCGFTPQLVTCVWVGYPKGEIPLVNVEGVPEVFGGTIPAEIWHDFMMGALANQPVLSFVTPDFSQNTVFPTVPYGPTSPSPSPSSPSPPPPPPKHCHKHHCHV